MLFTDHLVDVLFATVRFLNGICAQNTGIVPKRNMSFCTGPKTGKAVNVEGRKAIKVLPALTILQALIVLQALTVLHALPW